MKMESYSRKCSGAGYLALENTCRDEGRPSSFFRRLRYSSESRTSGGEVWVERKSGTWDWSASVETWTS